MLWGLRPEACTKHDAKRAPDFLCQLNIRPIVESYCSLGRWYATNQIHKNLEVFHSTIRNDKPRIWLQSHASKELLVLPQIFKAILLKAHYYTP